MSRLFKFDLRGARPEYLPAVLAMVVGVSVAVSLHGEREGDETPDEGLSSQAPGPVDLAPPSTAPGVAVVAPPAPPQDIAPTPPPAPSVVPPSELPDEAKVAEAATAASRTEGRRRRRRVRPKPIRKADLDRGEAIYKEARVDRKAVWEEYQRSPDRARDKITKKLEDLSIQGSAYCGDLITRYGVPLAPNGQDSLRIAVTAVILAARSLDTTLQFFGGRGSGAKGADQTCSRLVT